MCSWLFDRWSWNNLLAKSASYTHRMLTLITLWRFFFVLVSVVGPGWTSIPLENPLPHKAFSSKFSRRIRHSLHAFSAFFRRVAFIMPRIRGSGHEKKECLMCRGEANPRELQRWIILHGTNVSSWVWFCWNENYRGMNVEFTLDNVCWACRVYFGGETGHWVHWKWTLNI